MWKEVKKKEREICRATSGNKDMQGYRMRWHAGIQYEVILTGR